MRVRSVLTRRPSAALVISLVALFVALGGAGYAAVVIPNNSVGTAQLKNNAVSNSKLKDNSVTYKKILPGSVGIVRANTSQLQVRVSGTCAPLSAIGSIDSIGKVSCNSTLPPETGVVDTRTPGSTPTLINTVPLASPGRYLALANPSATVGAGTPASVGSVITVTCTLTAGGSSQTRSVTVTVGTSQSIASIPLQVQGSPGNATVSCARTSSSAPTVLIPVVSVTSSLNVLQVA